MAKVSASEGDIFRALATRFASPEFVLLPQVRNSVGFAKQARTADALAISTFPSRGVYAHGLEIKVTRSDWRRELADAAKADSIAKHCLYWSIAAPEGVVPVDELPPNWGLIECKEGGSKIKKQPKGLDEVVPPDWSFTAAVLRAFKAHVAPEDEVAKKVEKARWAGAQEERDRNKAEKDRDQVRQDGKYEELLRHVQNFEKESGLKISQRWDHPERTADAVRLVLRLGLADQEGDRSCLYDLLKRLDRAKESVTEFVREFDPPESVSP